MDRSSIRKLTPHHHEKLASLRLFMIHNLGVFSKSSAQKFHKSIYSEHLCLEKSHGFILRANKLSTAAYIYYKRGSTIGAALFHV